MDIFENIRKEYDDIYNNIVNEERQKTQQMFDAFKKQSEDRIAKMVEDTKAELEALGITL